MYTHMQREIKIKKYIKYTFHVTTKTKSVTSV